MKGTHNVFRILIIYEKHTSNTMNTPLQTDVISVTQEQTPKVDDTGNLKQAEEPSRLVQEKTWSLWQQPQQRRLLPCFYSPGFCTVITMEYRTLPQWISVVK